MNKMIKFTFVGLVFASVAVLSGCTHTAPTYSASIDNLNSLKAISSSTDRKISLSTFSSKDPKKSIMCRLDEEEALPNGMNYAQYIQHALKGELKYAGLFSDKSGIVVSARLNALEFSSTSGYWLIDMTFSSNQGKPFTIKSKTSFSSSFIADKACQQVSEQFVPAVQEFLRKLYVDKNFLALIKSRKKG